MDRQRRRRTIAAFVVGLIAALLVLTGDRNIHGPDMWRLLPWGILFFGATLQMLIDGARATLDTRVAAPDEDKPGRATGQPSVSAALMIGLTLPLLVARIAAALQVYK